MEITFEEAALQLSRWRDDKTVILASHLTRNRKNSTMIMCNVVSFDGCLTLVDNMGTGQIAATYSFEGASWFYMEAKDLMSKPDYMREMLSADSPILVLGWQDLELVTMQPLSNTD